MDQTMIMLYHKRSRKRVLKQYRKYRKICKFFRTDNKIKSTVIKMDEELDKI